MNKLRKKEIKAFKRFLKEKGIYSAYFRNVHNQKYLKEGLLCHKYNGNINDLLKNYYCFKKIIDASFIWRLTPEGQDFWQGIDNKFNYYDYPKYLSLYDKKFELI